MNDLSCPICGTELSMAQLFANDESQRAYAELAEISIPLGSRVLQYLTLFTPARQRLTIPKQVKLVKQLLPDLKRQAITFKGRDWNVPLQAWALGIDQMLAARDAGRLDLPMSGHGYLYAILASMADRVEGSAEAQREQERRNPARQAMPSAPGPVSVAAAFNAASAPVHTPAPAPAPGTSPLVRRMRAGLVRKDSPTPKTPGDPS
jgi:hypothetical protein